MKPVGKSTVENLASGLQSVLLAEQHEQNLKVSAAAGIFGGSVTHHSVTHHTGAPVSSEPVEANTRKFGNNSTLDQQIKSMYYMFYRYRYM